MNAIMRITCRWFMIVTIFGCRVLLVECLARTQDPQPLAVTVALEKEVISLHEPVLVTFTVRNSTSEKLDLNPGDDFELIHIEVTEPDGHVMNKPPPALKEGMRFGHAVHVEPRTTGVIFVLLNDWFNFDKIGTYHIKVVAPSPSSSSLGDPQPTVTRLTLSVLPRDEAALATACTGLTKRMENWKSAADSIIAARALSMVKDPAVVPCLAKALNQKLYTSMMISALARLNTPKSLDAIRAAAESTDPETSSLARATLRALGKANRPR